MENVEKVLGAFKSTSEPLNAGRVAEMTGLDKKEVEKAMNQLKKDDLIISPVRCKWTAK